MAALYSVTSLRKFMRLYRSLPAVRWLALGVVVGFFAGLAAAAFYLGVEYLSHLFLTTWAGFHLPAPAGEGLFDSDIATTVERHWLVPCMLTGVGLLTGFLIQRFIPDSINSGTDGTDSMIKSFHRELGVIKPIVPLIKGLMAILTIACGGSAGQEGPISQVGAGLGSWISDKLGLTTRERRILLLAGAAGGLGAIFRAPLGGALTAIEVIYREDFEAEAILPAVISSVVAYSVFAIFFGTTPILSVPPFHFHSITELFFSALLAVACAGAGWLYVRAFYAIKYSFFARIRAKIGITWTCALGGLLMGIFGMLFPQVLAGGYGWLQQAISGNLPLLLMLAIIFGKILATSLTIGSGLSGGMFAPALFVGGMTGGLVGHLSKAFFPNAVQNPGAFVLVGMAAFFSGIANAPIGPIVMVCEITQGYGLLAPLLLASMVTLVIGRKVSLYENQVENKFESPAHTGDATINVLERLQVKEFLRRGRTTVLDERMTLKTLTQVISDTNELNFPVRGEDDVITGVLPLQDVRRVLYEDALFELVVVRDLMRKPATLLPNDDLYTALLKFVDTDYSQIPVINPEDHTEVLGLLNRADVFQAYSHAIRTLKEEH
ncbi:putative signal transduction protein with CBS domain containing protein [Desulfovibrio sp. X2]|uniref:chloride channel protein n=1 Tax=Desulfovibrio sp. X2 TaxID=941449 RepID=UPI000358A109|nr:chloride channel protein [Desulfovibrio sp. X2]EPR43906.1 putative signal transduction protein with CBS domain containing protein [Desulfovibrio sp. X2]